MSNNLHISLSLAELQYVLNALAQRPYAEVNELVHNIKSQAEAELQRMTPVRPELSVVSNDSAND